MACPDSNTPRKIFYSADSNSPTKIFSTTAMAQVKRKLEFEDEETKPRFCSTPRKRQRTLQETTASSSDSSLSTSDFSAPSTNCPLLWGLDMSSVNELTVEDSDESVTQLLSLANYSTQPYEDPSTVLKILGSTITIESSLNSSSQTEESDEHISLAFYSSSIHEASETSSSSGSSHNSSTCENCKKYNTDNANETWPSSMFERSHHSSRCEDFHQSSAHILSFAVDSTLPDEEPSVTSAKLGSTITIDSSVEIIQF